jgi:hypothetical protein
MLDADTFETNVLFCLGKILPFRKRKYGYIAFRKKDDTIDHAYEKCKYLWRLDPIFELCNIVYVPSSDLIVTHIGKRSKVSVWVKIQDYGKLKRVIVPRKLNDWGYFAQTLVNSLLQDKVFLQNVSSKFDSTKSEEHYDVFKAEVEKCLSKKLSENGLVFDKVWSVESVPETLGDLGERLYNSSVELHKNVEHLTESVNKMVY